MASFLPHGQIVLRGHGWPQVRRLELWFWRSSGECPRTYPHLRLRVPHLQNNGSSRHQVSSVRRRYPTLHGGEILGFNLDGGTLEVRCSPDVLVSRQWATVEFWQNRSHDFRYKAGSIQAWPSVLLGHRRRRRGEGKHQNPWCSSWSNIIHGQSSEGINQSMQLPHPCSPTRPPRPDTRISQVDRPRPCNISSWLLQLAAVRHLQVKSQQTTARAEWSCASRAPSCLEIQLGALAQTASLAPGSAKDHIQDGTHYIQREILQAAFLSLQSPGQLHAITEPEVWGTTSSSDSLSEVCGSQTQLLFWRANRLEQSKFENSRSRLTRVIQDTFKDRTV